MENFEECYELGDVRNERKTGSFDLGFGFLGLEQSSVLPGQDVCPLDIQGVLDHIARELAAQHVEEVVDVIEKVDPEIRISNVINGLAYVGICSDDYNCKPKFSPHNRDFFLLPSIGEFTFEGETVENFFIPPVGAEKMSGKFLSSLGVASPAGVISSGVYTDIIDSAREKLNGTEIVIYTIETRSRRVSFKWSVNDHVRLPVSVDPGHFEDVDGVIYFLTGFNSLCAREHRWEYLSNDLIRRVEFREGIIVRFSGKQYRLPWRNTATFNVIDNIARDLTGNLSFATSAPNGLSDFFWNPGTKMWHYLCHRPDKVRADANSGISEMLHHSVTLSVFLKAVPIGQSAGFSPCDVRVVPMSPDRDTRVIQCMSLDEVKIRVTGGYKQPDSYRRILLEDCGDRKVGTNQVCHTRPNIINSCGRVVFFKRHEKILIISYRGEYFVSHWLLGIGKVIYFKLVKFIDGAININGPTMRLYRLNLKLFNFGSDTHARIVLTYDLLDKLLSNIIATAKQSGKLSDHESDHEMKLVFSNSVKN